LGEQLVGRRQELAAIDVFLDEAADGAAAALVLEGEAGIGKTSVWREGVERARNRGFRLLTARPVGAEVRLSLAGLGDLLGDAVDETLPSLPEPQRNALEVALLRAESRGSPDVRAVGVALAEVLRTLSRRAAVLIAVDDLQWLDRPSGELIAFALRRLDAEPVRLLASVRAEPGVGVPFELDRALGDERLRRLRLGPLSLGALHELLRSRLGLALGRPTLVRLHATTGGNPYFALEVGRELVRLGVEPTPGHPLPVPDDLRALLRGRLRRLPAPTRSVLLLAAALPRPTVDLLGAISGSPEQVAAELDAAQQAGVVELDDEQVHFTHPLLADVCYADAPARQRRTAHARIADVVSGREASALHLALAVDGPDEAAARSLTDAARHAAGRGAPGAAAEFWELASRLTPPERDADRRERLLEAADSRLRVGDFAGARERFECLLADARGARERAELLLRVARTRDDDVAIALALCRDALREGGDEGFRSRAHLYMNSLHERRGDMRRALRHARRALDLAELAGDAELVASALFWTAWFEIGTLDLTPGLVERALDLEGSELLAAFQLACQDQLDEARTLLEAQLDTATVAGNEGSIGSLLYFLTELECAVGNWARADERAAECYELWERRGIEPEGSVALGCRAFVDARLGRVGDARRAGERGVALAAATGNETFRLRNVGILGFLELSLGNVEAAAFHLRDLPARLVEVGWNEPAVAFPVWPDAIEALIGVGELELARSYLHQYDVRIRTFRTPSALATAARCHGLLAMAERDLEGARTWFGRSLSEHERGPRPLDRARTLLAVGMVERRAKQKRAAREALQDALAIFEELGAQLWAERARGELARIGGRAPAAGELTPAEHRVAELVAEGRTNREAASLLVVSEHTIDSHLRRVYRKLGVRSRAELAHHFAAHAQNRTEHSR
jgi:DNA-binding CsgD family transcriptional regulator